MRFVEWIEYELQRREWSQNELARRLGISSGRISMILNEQRGFRADFCQDLARVFDIPEVLVLMRAGLMEETRDETELTLRELYEILKALPIEEQRAIVEDARERYRSIHGDTTLPDPATTR